jgi:WD40 domain-containing protein
VDAIQAFKVQTSAADAQFGPLSASGLDPPNGQMLVSVSGEKAARLWSTAEGKVRSKVGGAENAGLVAFSPDGNLVATAGGGKVRVVDAASGDDVNGRVESLTFTRGGQCVAVTASGQSGELWNVTRGMQLRSVQHGPLCAIGRAQHAGKAAGVGQGRRDGGYTGWESGRRLPCPRSISSQRRARAEGRLSPAVAFSKKQPVTGLAEAGAASAP